MLPLGVRLVAYGDDIGVLWAQGSVIYTCAGCMPDHHLRFVVLDGEDLTPLSGVVELENLEPFGGYLQPRMVRDGDDFAILADLQYHTSGEAAWGGVRCSPLE